MAPLTRARAGRERVPNDLVTESYTQRASAGMIITEATPIGKQPRETPRALEAAAIASVVQDYRRAAEHAKAAGCNGLEIHAADGWERNPPADSKERSAPTAQGCTEFPFHRSLSRT
jgi:2,4-dienoyl-CoA reductase-like NADH-dependent reductase (Old Yellow Enzyme family)